MSVAALLADCEAAGITVLERDGQLVIRGPKSARAIVEKVIASKIDVMSYLQAIDQFATWIQQPDCNGVLGWEPADLDQRHRLWSITTFAGEV